MFNLVKFFFSARTSEQSSEHTEFVSFFEQDSVETHFIANGYSTNHVPTRVQTA